MELRVNDQVETLATLGWVPADALVSVSHLPCRRAEAKQGQQLIIGAPHEIAHRGTDELARPEIVKLVEQLIKKSEVAALKGHGEAKWPEGTKELIDSRAGLADGELADGTLSAERIAPSGGKAKMAPGIKLQEDIPHGPLLELAIGLTPLEKSA